jgi:hydroxylamine reductase (hybrid-cluster protein)
MENKENIFSSDSDGASAAMFEKIRANCVETCFERPDLQKNQCDFGRNDVCCRICHMGPCRITSKSPKGICGATADTIAARNFLREVVGGTSAHSDYGRRLILKLKEVAEGKAPGFQIKDVKALRRAARLYGIEEEGRSANGVAIDLSKLFLNEFSEQEGFLRTLELASKKQQSVWEAAGIKPHGIDRMVVEAMHLSSIGVDPDYLNLLHHAFRVALANGWGVSRMASIVSDILFGTPSPIESTANVGVFNKISIPKEKENFIAGFSVSAIKYMLGGRFRASFRLLNDAIMQNRILGVVGFVGCTNPNKKTDNYTNVLTAELIKRNVLVLQTGCSATASAKAGMLKPEVAAEQAGPGLREICETVGIPPVLHLGSCVDNTRILETATEIIFEGGLGDDMASLPVVGVAPELMSEKDIAIGCYFVASGIDVILGNPFYVSVSQAVNNYLHGGVREEFGASFHLIEDPMETADRIIDLLNQARDVLGINKKAERKLFDMKDRRAI